MQTNQSLPVIIGSGVSGMAISDWLSQAKIPHLMVGAPPTDLPRLGESIDPAGTLILLRYYPEFDRFYYRKRWISVFLGDYATSCNFGQNFGRVVGLKMLGFTSPSEFIHVDRVGFDNALYAKVTASQYCQRNESLVESLVYDKEADAIKEICLMDGTLLQPTYVYDCTNHVRLLGKNLKIPLETISEPQRVVFDHFRAHGDAPMCNSVEMEWLHATNILRLYDDPDGFNGLSWLIPLGNYVSCGVSIPHGETELSDDKITELLGAAYARRGMPYLEYFPNPTHRTSVPYQQYFFYERAYGKNWLLAGPSFGQVWFPSSSGVGAAMVAGYIAADIIQNPEQVGQLYQDYIVGLKESHTIFDRMIKLPHNEMTPELVKVESNRIVTENVKRVARLATIQSGAVGAAFGRLLIKAVSREGRAASGCVVFKADMPEQTRTIFAEA